MRSFSKHRNVVLAICCVGLAILCLFLAASPQVQSDSRPLKVMPGSADLGKVAQGSEVAVEFRFLNEGENALRIVDVSTSCSCTDANLSVRELAPGESTIAKLTFRSKGIRGPTTNWVWVSYLNGESLNEKSMLIPINASVVPDYDVTPEKLEFTKSEPATRSIHLLSNRSPAVSILDAHANRPWFEVVAGASDIQVTFRPELYIAEPTLGTLTLTTDSVNDRRFQVPLVLGE